MDVRDGKEANEQSIKGMNTNFVSSIISTSWVAVIGVLECPAVGSSLASSPLVEETTCVHKSDGSFRALQRSS